MKNEDGLNLHAKNGNSAKHANLKIISTVTIPWDGKNARNLRLNLKEGGLVNRFIIKASPVNRGVPRLGFTINSPVQIEKQNQFIFFPFFGVNLPGPAVLTSELIQNINPGPKITTTLQKLFI